MQIKAYFHLSGFVQVQSCFVLFINLCWPGLSGFVQLCPSCHAGQTAGGYVVPPLVQGMSRQWLLGIGQGIGQGARPARHGAASALPPDPLRRHGPRRSPRAHTMPRPMPAPAQGSSAPMPAQRRIAPMLRWTTSISFSKRSSTGWGRCRCRPPPQMGSPWPTLRFMHKICREIQNEALRYPYRLTRRPNLPIILKDSPKSGQKWLKPINLPRATQPAVARVARKAQRTSPR